MPEDRDQLARDLIGCFPVLDKSDRSAADASPGPTALIAELAALTPGWESPTALQAAYSEILATYEQVEAERDRRGDELRRAQALVSRLSKRIAVLRAEADEKFCTCESYDCHGECCGVGNCTCTALEGQP